MVGVPSALLCEPFGHKVSAHSKHSFAHLAARKEPLGETILWLRHSLGMGSWPRLS